MHITQRQLLYCLKAYRLGQAQAEITEELTAEDWSALYQLSAEHKLSPVVYETLHAAPDFCGRDQALAAAWKRDTILQAAGQAARTQKLLELTNALDEAGIRCAVVKGAVCRRLYGKPDLRLSGDEDILIPAEARQHCGEVFARCGMTAVTHDGGCVDHWQDPRTGLHVELHTKLFDSGWAAEAVLNPYFSEQLLHTVPAQLERGAVQTLEPTAHFVFLVSHALKHFIAGGFGVRTLCDILTFAEYEQERIDRDTVWDLLEQIQGAVFFQHLLSLGQTWLAFDPAPWGRPLPKTPDSEELLEDMLDAGIYGQTSMSRRHSAALVLEAAKEGQTKPSLVRALFPPREKLLNRYPVLERVPALLPVMWLRRLGSYGLELIRSGGKGNSPGESIALGKKRTEMMVKYGVIPKNKTED